MAILPSRTLQVLQPNHNPIKTSEMLLMLSLGTLYVVHTTLVCLSLHNISPAEAGDIFCFLLRVHFKRYEVLTPDNNKTTDVVKRTRRIENGAEHLRQLKNMSRRRRRLDRHSFNNLLRAHNKAKKMCDQLITDRRLRARDKAFRSDP